MSVSKGIVKLFLFAITSFAIGCSQTKFTANTRPLSTSAENAVGTGSVVVTDPSSPSAPPAAPVPPPVVCSGPDTIDGIALNSQDANQVLQFDDSYGVSFGMRSCGNTVTNLIGFQPVAFPSTNAVGAIELLGNNNTVSNVTIPKELVPSAYNWLQVIGDGNSISDYNAYVPGIPSNPANPSYPTFDLQIVGNGNVVSDIDNNPIVISMPADMGAPWATPGLALQTYPMTIDAIYLWGSNNKVCSAGIAKLATQLQYAKYPDTQYWTKGYVDVTPGHLSLDASSGTMNFEFNVDLFGVPDNHGSLTISASNDDLCGI